ncbi:MAG: insulinase family protein [Anaerolineae bacterium]|nr:insulinase family protein [Anaerolineae bacterium]
MVSQNKHIHAIPGPDDIHRVELENGIIVLARENFTSPSVVMEGRISGGALLEPAEKAGLANFHSAMLMRGTARHTFDQLFEEIESIGASLDIDSGGHTCSFGSKSLAEDLPTMLQLLSETLRQPTFPAEHIEKERGEIMTSLQMRAHDTRRMAALTFSELAYPDHPYGSSVKGYLETVAGITREDIVNFQTNLGPRGAIIVVVGAFKAQEAISLVEKTLGDWVNPAQASRPEAPPVSRITDVRYKFVPIPGKSQADIVMGYPGPARSAPDFQAARVANSILGQFGLMGRLGDAVREDQGLAYYSYSQLDGGFGPGPWKIMAGVNPENIERAVETIRQEIGRMVREPVTAEELADNKSFFKGQLVISLETNEGVAGSILNMEQHQLGLDYLRNYAAMIDALTADDLQAAAARYLDPDAYALAVAGPERDV